MGMKELDQILKILKNELSETEKNAFYKQIEEDEQLRELYYQQKNMWVKTGITPVLTAEERNDDIQTIWKKISHYPRLQFLHAFYRYAAIIIVAIMVGSLAGYFVKDKMAVSDELITSVYSFSSGERSISKVELPDGSVLSLNAHTKVTYRKDNKSQKRLVTLDGEAHFNVVHNEASPFVIDFGQLEIIDIGTAFNVKASKQSDFIETTLMEGKVDVVVNKSDITSLTPGQKASYSKIKQQVVVTSFDSIRVTAWMKNRFIFKNETLEDILKDLGKWHDVAIYWEKETYKSERLHLNIERTTPIETVLEMLVLSVNFKYEIIKKDGDVIKVIIKEANQIK